MSQLETYDVVILGSGQGGKRQSVSVTVRTEPGDRTIEGSHLLVAAGRIPNTANIGLDRVPWRSASPSDNGREAS